MKNRKWYKFVASVVVGSMMTIMSVTVLASPIDSSTINERNSVAYHCYRDYQNCDYDHEHNRHCWR